jgi:hypothetical protein
MMRKELYLVLAVSLIAGCSGHVELGNGDGTDGGGKVDGSGGGIGVMMGAEPDGGSTTTEPDGGSTTEPSEAGIVASGDGGSCFPDCELEAGSGPPPDGGTIEVADGGYTPCGGAECGPGESCIATTTTGGPCEPPGDGGTCPKGTTLEGGCCVSPPETVYVCQITPAKCSGGVLTCGCSTSQLCNPSNACSCNGVKDNVLDCECEAP